MRDVLILALYLLPALALRALGWRLVRLTNAHRVGHLAGEVDCLLKEELLGLAPRMRLLLLAPRGEVANERLAAYWARHLRSVRSPWLCRLLAPANRFAFMRAREDMSCYVAAVGRTAESMRIQKLWADRPPLLELSPEDRARGERALVELGLPPGARFVCLHSREGGYSPQDEHLHGFRNTPVESYLGAAAALMERGLYCLRMGDPTMRKLPPKAGVFDYAHSALRADWLDLFLCARCEFFLGNSSGLSFLAAVFGRPLALANLVPFSGAFPYYPKDVGIPMLLWSRTERRYLRFSEILASAAANFRFADLYRRHGIEPRENAAVDVCDLALEMLDRVEGRAAYTAEDEQRQERLRALFCPGHFSYGSSARVGRDFLRKYEHLIGDRPGQP